MSVIIISCEFATIEFVNVAVAVTVAAFSHAMYIAMHIGHLKEDFVRAIRSVRL